MRLLNLFGYLDPGSGSIIIQSIIGIFAGIGLFGRKVIASTLGKIRKFLARLK